MKNIKVLEHGELPKSVKKFWLIRQDQDFNLILEFYEKKGEYNWENECIHVFKGYTPYNKTEVLREAKKFIHGGNTLYVEEETFWDEV